MMSRTKMKQQKRAFLTLDNGNSAQTGQPCTSAMKGSWLKFHWKPRSQAQAPLELGHGLIHQPEFRKRSAVAQHWQRLIGCLHPGTQCTVTKCTAGLYVPVRGPVLTAMAVRLFEGKDHAAAYLRYRVAPQQLISRILNFMNKEVKRWNEGSSNVRLPHLLSSY